MRKTSRLLPLLYLLAAACAHDGILAPEVEPEPARAEMAAAEPTAEPVGRPKAVRLSCRGSLLPSGPPLYVLDGVVLETLPADLDADRIDRIEVVKGAEAMALYGARGAHGVVRITLRAGQAERP